MTHTKAYYPLYIAVTPYYWYCIGDTGYDIIEIWCDIMTDFNSVWKWPVNKTYGNSVTIKANEEYVSQCKNISALQVARETPNNFLFMNLFYLTLD